MTRKTVMDVLKTTSVGTTLLMETKGDSYRCRLLGYYDEKHGIGSYVRLWNLDKALLFDLPPNYITSIRMEE